MKKILIIITITVMTFTITGCGCSKNEKKLVKKEKTPVVKTNDKEGVIKDQQVEMFKMQDTSVTYDGETSTLITFVTNTSNETQTFDSFNIVVKDKDGKELITMLGFANNELKAGETKTIISSTDVNLLKAASVEYSVNR